MNDPQRIECTTRSALAGLFRVILWQSSGTSLMQKWTWNGSSGSRLSCTKTVKYFLIVNLQRWGKNWKRWKLQFTLCWHHHCALSNRRHCWTFLRLRSAGERRPLSHASTYTPKWLCLQPEESQEGQVPSLQACSMQISIVICCDNVQVIHWGWSRCYRIYTPRAKPKSVYIWWLQIWIV